MPEHVMAASVRPRIGLLGGSFDPVHLAHLALARAALKHLELDALQFIPAAQPWQRRPLQASATQRLTMLRLALDGEPGLEINTSELVRGGPTYTIDTVRQLPPDADYLWVLGADQLVNFCSWRDWEAILTHVDLAVAQRPGSPSQAPAALADWLVSHGRRLTEIPFAPQPMSASEIRSRCAHGESLSGWVLPQVAAYIATHKLYQTPAST